MSPVYMLVTQEASFFVSAETAKQVAAAYEDGVIRALWVTDAVGAPVHVVMSCYRGVWVVSREQREAEDVIAEQVGMVHKKQPWERDAED